MRGIVKRGVAGRNTQAHMSETREREKEGRVNMATGDSTPKRHSTGNYRNMASVPEQNGDQSNVAGGGAWAVVGKVALGGASWEPSAT